MKKRMLAVMLPVAAFVALAGTGFGVWVFNETTAASAGANYTVTDAVAMNGLTLELTDKDLVLDQNSSDLQIAGTIGAKIDMEHGGVGTAQSELTNKWSDSTGSQTLTAKYNVAIDNGLSTYIAVKDVKVADAVAQTTGFSFPQTWTADATDSKAIVVNFEWTAAKPGNMKAYTDMIAAIKTKAITVTVSVSDVAFVA
jgi:hypothetical protein